MTAKIYGFDPVTLSPTVSSVNLSAVIETIEDFDVSSSGGQSAFQLVTHISASSVIKVFYNGRQAREGASYDFQRDNTLYKINFNYNLVKDTWVRVEIRQ